MARFLIRWGINALALYVAVIFVNRTIGGITLQNPGWQTYLWLGLIFGLLNALLRPLLQALTCPLILLTLGLFTLVLNTLLFYLAGAIGRGFGVGYTVESFGAAFLGALCTSAVSIVLSLLLKDELEEKRRRRSG